MNVTLLQSKIDEHLMQHSGLEQKRDYLGISAIGRCPRQVVREYLNGKGEMSLRDHQMCYAGYLFERDMMMRLREIGVAKTPIPGPSPEAGEGGAGYEVVAPFDQRLRGHVLDHLCGP